MTSRRERHRVERAVHSARVTFGEVVRIAKERTTNPDRDGFDRYVGLEHISPNDLLVRAWGDVSDGTSFSTVFRAGQTLFVKRRAYQRKVAIATFDGVCSSDIYVLEPATDEITPEYIAFVCQSDRFVAHAIETSAGSLSPRTTWRSLSSFDFVLPSIDRQRELTELGVAADRVARAYGVLAQRAATVATAFREREFGNAVSRHGAELRPLGELVVLERTPVTPVANQSYREVGVRSFGNGIFHKEPTTGERLGSKRVFAVEQDRLMLNIVFAWEGAVALTSEDDEGFVASHRFPMYRSSNVDFDLRFLYYFLLSSDGLRKLSQASPGGAGRNKTLGKKEFLATTVPVPSHVVQLGLISRLEQLIDKSNAVRARHEAAIELRRRVVDFVGDAPMVDA